MFQLPTLPYAKNALEPTISENTINFHYEKHHAGYIAKLNALTEHNHFAEKSLEEIIFETKEQPLEKAIFNNAAQVWNHTFYWSCMMPNGGGEPNPEVLAEIEKNFDNFEEFKKEFVNVAVSQFGSGWAWLVRDESNALRIISTSNADTPIAYKFRPILTVDVWEHAYYLDYQNRRAEYVELFLEKLVNWDFVRINLDIA